MQEGEISILVDAYGSNGMKIVSNSAKSHTITDSAIFVEEY